MHKCIAALVGGLAIEAVSIAFGGTAEVLFEHIRKITRARVTKLRSNLFNR
ncbi:hypothetical protein D3C85_1118480 [compost metagenome]